MVREVHMKSCVRRKWGIVALLVVLLAGAVYGVLVRKPMAPDVTFNTLDGRQISMASLKGKVVYVDFWATSCVGCVRDAPELAKIYRQYHAQGLEMIGVNAAYAPPNYVRKFVQDFQVPYPDMLDPQGMVAHAFGDV
jgi:peroxiredoxin